MLLLNWRGDFSCYYYFCCCEPNLSFFFPANDADIIVCGWARRVKWRFSFAFFFLPFLLLWLSQIYAQSPTLSCVFVHSSLLLSACHKFFSPTVLILCSERCDAHTLDIWHVKEERDYYCLPSFLLLFYGKKKESLRLLRHEIFIWLIITTSQHWGEKSVVGSKVRNINSSVFAQKQQQFGYYSYTVAILSLLKLKCAPFSPGFDLRLFPFPSSPSFPGQEVNIMANKKFNIFSITHAESELFSLYVPFAGKRNKLLEPGHLKCWGKESKGKKLY